MFELPAETNPQLSHHPADESQFAGEAKMYCRPFIWNTGSRQNPAKIEEIDELRMKIEESIHHSSIFISFNVPAPPRWR
jgi:hypothetical protein